MKKVLIHCDLCETECLQRFGVFSGCVMKMNEKGEFAPMVFEAHYCEDDTVKILKFIEKLNEELSEQKSKPTDGRSGTGKK